MRNSNPLALGLAAWLFPGAGHHLLGERPKAALFSVLILASFIAGLAMGGAGSVFIGPGRYATIAQAPAGLVALAAFAASRLRGVTAFPDGGVGPGFGIGTLYTSVAGLLNALLVFDAVVKCYERKLGMRIER